MINTNLGRARKSIAQIGDTSISKGKIYLMVRYTLPPPEQQTWQQLARVEI